MGTAASIRRGSVVAVLAVGLLAGCAETRPMGDGDPRVRHMERTVEAAVLREQEAPLHLPKIEAVLQSEDRVRGSRLERDLLHCGRKAAYDLERWDARQIVYARVAGEALDGDPADMAQTLSEVLR